ncbi:MAG: ZIP family metal transporter [Thermoplasmata archaeon]|nr:MAG: ZIP family metal transporter [Thermoplasmata archaeon]
MSYLWMFTLASVVLVSVISLIGILTLSIKESILKKIMILFVSFSAGALLGDAFIHLLPEVVEEHGFGLNISLFALSGILIFFVLEKLIYWRHCHILTSEEHVHTFTYMNLIGDGVHNFIDGMIIAGSFMISISLGLATTIAVILHEVPQEIGDFSVLIYGGFSKSKAIFYNLVAALGAVIGAVLMLIIGSFMSYLPVFLVPFTAGGFIYVAGTDLIPELQKEVRPMVSLAQMGALLLGIGIMSLLVLLE